MALKRQVWEVQSHTHDTNGKPIFTPDIIEQYLKDHADSIMRWAWCLHDKDRYTKEDEIKSAERNNGVPTVFEGQLKPPHIHLDLEFTNEVYNTALAKEFGLPVGQIIKPTVKYNKMDALVTYLTHEAPEEQEKKKYLYPDSEIHANFNFREVINGYLKKKAKSAIKKRKKASADAIIEKIVVGEMSIEDVKREYGFAYYLDYEQRFLKARREYMLRYYQMLPRINYYIDGPSGRGKTTLAEMLARVLVPDLEDYEAYCEVGEPGVRFQNYDYQPVLIWEDVRAGQLISEFGREGVLNLLETHPRKRNYNIKYDGVVLTNQVNIFTGIESYDKFLDGLAGEYQDKNGRQYKSETYAKEQVYRRVPVIIHLYPQDIMMMANKGVFEGTDEYLQYEIFANARANMLSVNKHYTLSARDAIAKQIVGPVKDKHDEFMLLQSSDGKVSDPDEIPVIEVAVGIDACKEMESRAREEYEQFVQAYLKKNNAALQKQAATPNPKNRTAEEIGRGTVISFDEWLAAGRPSVPGEKYVDTYADAASLSWERQVEKDISTTEDVRQDRDEEWLEEQERSKEEAAETFFESMEKLAEHRHFMIELSTLFNNLQNTRDLASYYKCVACLHQDYIAQGEHNTVISNEPLVKSLIDYVLSNGLEQSEQNFWAFVCQNGD